MSNIKQAAIEFYLDWFNNFINADSMAYHYNMTTEQCLQLINMGRQWYAELLELQSVKNSDTSL